MHLPVREKIYHICQPTQGERGLANATGTMQQQDGWRDSPHIGEYLIQLGQFSFATGKSSWRRE
jgi:hypothetical protein